VTAPDSGLTDLIAAHQAGERWTDFEYPSIFSDEPYVATTVTKMVNCSCGESMSADSFPAHVALVVEQHTNGRIAEENEILRNDTLEAENERKGWTTRALTAEATIARVRAVEAEYLDPDLEGEQE
jgi:hypothetical protein